MLMILSAELQMARVRLGGLGVCSFVEGFAQQAMDGYEGGSNRIPKTDLDRYQHVQTVKIHKDLQSYIYI